MKESDLKIIFIGTPEFSVPILEALIKEGYKIVGVVTKPDEPVGRKQVLTPPPVKILAQKLEIPVFQPEKLKDENFINQIKNLTSDLIVVAAYGKIIPKAILDIPRYGAINIHGSLLPSLRGASPIQYAILNGDKETGVTIILMDEEMDHGPLLGKSEIRTSLPSGDLPRGEKPDTYESLSKKLSELGEELLVKTIPGYISGEIKPKEQDHTKATYTKIIKKEDGKIDWSKSADEIERMVRAFYQWPTAWTTWNGKILKILEADTLDEESATVFFKNRIFELSGVFLTTDKRLAVKCGAGILIIKKLQLEGGKVLSAQEFLNGHKDFRGSKLG